MLQQRKVSYPAVSAKLPVTHPEQAAPASPGELRSFPKVAPKFGRLVLKLANTGGQIRPHSAKAWPALTKRCFIEPNFGQLRPTLIDVGQHFAQLGSRGNCSTIVEQLFRQLPNSCPKIQPTLVDLARILAELDQIGLKFDPIRPLLGSGQVLANACGL